MLSRLRQFGFRRDPHAAIIDRRLGLEAAEARVTPAPGLRRRTLAALQEACLRADRAPARQQPVGFAYAMVCGLLALLAVVATLHLGSSGGPPTQPAATDRAGPLRLLSFRAGRLGASVEAQLPLGGSTLETGLVKEARLIATDARQARAYLLARLPRVPEG